MARLTTKIGVGLGLSLGALSLSLLVAEVVVRQTTEVRPLPPRRGTLFSLVRPSATPGLALELRPGAEAWLRNHLVRVNSHGLRDRETSKKKPAGTTRICVVGDSVAFGWGVGQREMFSEVLERALQRRRKVEVLNFGVPAYNMTQIAVVVRQRVLDFDPDLVLVAHSLNDVGEPWYPFKTDSLLALRAEHWLSRYSALGMWVRLQLGSMPGRTGRPNFHQWYNNRLMPSWRDYIRALGDIAASTRARKVPVLVVLLPVWLGLDGRYLHLSEHRQVKEEVTRAGLPFWDLLPEFQGPGGRRYNKTFDFIHPHRQGHARIGELLARRLQRRF